MNFIRAFETFKEKTILIVGDVMVDSYINGSVSRISPEAPVPIVNFSNEENRLGGAANVALNVQSLGAKAIICSVVGSDFDGGIVKKLLLKNKLEETGIIVDTDRKTTKKTRIIAGNQQILRVDKEDTHYLNRQVEKAFFLNLKNIISKEKIDAIIFEDYNKGLLSKKLIEAIISLANKLDIITTVDPKKDNFFDYKNVTLFKPNLKELSEGLQQEISLKDKLKFIKSVEKIEKKINSTYSFITLSEHGVFIKNDEESYFIPAHFRNITDVSGAGDTVISVATLALTTNLPMKMVAEIANLAGGMVCEKVGVVSINKNELLAEAMRVLN